MISIRKQITHRMSLRKPQEASLECLERLVELIPMTAATDLPPIEDRVKQAFPEFEAFERNCPNICFALATGVGKTRLMGAMIAYLADAKGIRNFVVLAPNTTITEKLVREFRETKDPKYVFKGLPEFANRTPRIITSENYEDMSSLLARPESDDFNPESITINVFNIALLHTKERKIRNPKETIDASLSYFDYLASRKDLVVFMDEAHHCRAKAGARTIEELNPILGIELTATPQTQSSKGEVPFRNIIYRFTLPEALKAGYLKRLGIGGRSNFDCSTLSDDALEKLKLEDGLTVHRNLQAELWNYTSQRNIRPVKPFVLVIARDTDHANQIEELIKSPSFLSGRYANKVLTVHSQQSGEEKEETVRRLLEVESPENPIEIVIHVNMLREGWDVTNLYTIIPLRRAKSLTLIEQSLGRGARLPFGKRTGIDLIDRLYVVYHENFQKVVSEADKYLEVMERVEIDEFPPEPPKPVIVYPIGTHNPEPTLSTMTDAQPGETFPLPSPAPEQEEAILPSHHLKIPRIIIQPDPYARQGRFLPFTLNLQGFGPQPVDPTIVFIDPDSKEKTKFHSKISSHIEQKPEDVITNDLLDRDGVADTEENGSIVADLAIQMIQHLRAYLHEDMVKLVVHQHRSAITDKIYGQMLKNYEPNEEKMIHSIGKGSLTFGSASYLITQEPEHYKEPLRGRRIESLLWSGFEKSIYPMMKFQAEAERQFAAMLESDEEVISWIKPPKEKFRIYYRKDTTYEPDFVVETRNGKYLCEVKDRTKIEDSIVKEKAKAAIYWCQAANECTDKEWKYLLIPDNAINLTTTFAAYASRHEWKVQS